MENAVSDVRFSQHSCWGFMYCGMWHIVGCV